MHFRKAILLAGALLAFCLHAPAQQPSVNTGTVYVIRSMGMTGAAIPFNIFADDQLICKLHNQRYSIHTLPEGQHTFSVQNTGLGSHKKSHNISITVKADEAVYLTVVDEGQLNLKELTANSGIETLKRVAETRNCLPKKKGK
ncbi:hypothetical protein D3C80_1293140 [compost metagenome]